MKPDIGLAPRFTNFVSNNYHTTRDGTVYYNPHDVDSELARKEVDANPK
jgi:hypothetical protein